MTLRATRSLSGRLTLWFACSAAVVMLVLGWVMEVSIARHFVERDTAALELRLERLRELVAQPDDTALRAWVQRSGSAPLGQAAVAVAVLDAQGNVLMATPGTDFPAHLALPAGAGSRVVEWQADGVSFRGVAQPLQGARGEALALAALDCTQHDAFIRSFRLRLWMIVLLAATLLGALGWVVAQRGLAPLRKLGKMASGMTASRLHERLQVEDVPAELLYAVHTFNGMLDRLEASFARLADFSCDLAHEMRTPINQIMMQNQVALSRPRSVAEYQEVLACGVEELERLARMVADMLFLAKADNEAVVPSPEPVRLDAEVASLFEFNEALAESRGLTLVQSGAAEVRGDRLMLRRALANLLSNALRHATPATAVTVRIAQDAGFARVSVSNLGETIPACAIPRLFDRFYRADAARGRATEGVGLGLAITASILRAHGGEVSVKSQAGETCFTLSLPLPAAVGGGPGGRIQRSRRPAPGGGAEQQGSVGA